MKKLIRLAVAVAVVLPLSACHIYNKYERPDDSAIINELTKADQLQQDSTLLGNLSWKQVFTDPLLQSYIDTALVRNKDLNNARLNVEIAQAQLQGAKLSYFPSLAFTPNGGSASYGGSHMNWSYTLPLAASWEIDVFGKILNRKRGAKMGVEQAEAYRSAVQSQIIGAVANTYYAIAALNMQLEVSRQTAVLWKEQVSSMELMKNAGRVNEAAVVQTRAQYYAILASIPDLETALRSMQNTMSLLLNEFPADYQTTRDMTVSAPAEISEGVPMAYLAVRPDVAASERALAIAYYATNSARAAFYPSLNISAQGGFTNAIGSMIVNPGKWFIQLAGSLTAPIFSRGQNIANLKAAKAQQQQAMNNFEYTLLNAAAEVGDAMHTYTASKTKQELLAQQIDQLEKSVDYTNQLLTLGSATYLEVLTAQQGLLQAQLSEINCWHSRVAALVNLYQSLGGGR
ncbi:MAG: efflux transporter outer membrane subunit [Bacteroidales bacterium]|nr:efflux transporter outer membrane subunit [Bacteroidales bacterium]